jgi:hypothetical protein
VIPSNKLSMGASLLVGGLCGCATAPPIAPLPRGQSVSIAVIRSPQASGEIRIRNQALGDNTTTGAGSGMVIGALYGLSCGPLAVICVPFGAMVGGATGTAAGAAVGLTGALSEDTAAKVRARLVRVQQAHDMVYELGRDVTERASLQWSLKSVAPAYLMSVELRDIRLTSTRDERVGFVASVLIRVRPAGVEQRAATHEKVFEYVGPFVSLAEWLDEGSDVLDGNLSVASKQLALQVVAELTQR